MQATNCTQACESCRSCTTWQFQGTRTLTTTSSASCSGPAPFLAPGDYLYQVCNESLLLLALLTIDYSQVQAAQQAQTPPNLFRSSSSTHSAHPSNTRAPDSSQSAQPSQHRAATTSHASQPNGSSQSSWINANRPDVSLPVRPSSALQGSGVFAQPARASSHPQQSATLNHQSSAHAPFRSAMPGLCHMCQ